MKGTHGSIFYSAQIISHNQTIHSSTTIPKSTLFQMYIFRFYLLHYCNLYFRYFTAMTATEKLSGIVGEHATYSKCDGFTCRTLIQNPANCNAPHMRIRLHSQLCARLVVHRQSAIFISLQIIACASRMECGCDLQERNHYLAFVSTFPCAKTQMMRLLFFLLLTITG